MVRQLILQIIYKLKNCVIVSYSKGVFWARGSVDRATGSGPVGRGFKSLRARLT